MINEMLSREPLRKYVLFAQKCYYSNTVFDQIAQVHSLKGNEEKVYQDDSDYHTYMRMKENKIPPKKSTYFEQ